MKKKRNPNPDAKRVRAQNVVIVVGSMVLVFVVWFILVPLIFPGLYAKYQQWLEVPKWVSH